jgi:hypothetical protein
VIVHAPNKTLARQMVETVKGEEICEVSDVLTMRIGAELIDSVCFLGRVEHVVEVKYIKEECE